MNDIIDLGSDDDEYEDPKSCAHGKQKENPLALVGGDVPNKIVASSETENKSRSHVSGQITGNGSSHMEQSAPFSESEAVKSSQGVLPNSKFSRHFWRAGEYHGKPSGQKVFQGTMDHVRVHPKFLHSNATSHKWALGAIAELLDNAIDEVHNGATFVKVDKIVNPRDNSPALLVQDNGGGMDPDCMRHCMSLGYSRKNTNTMIGQYGNGFKTSTMRLGADVIVFSRCSHNDLVTQSIGLLSYTFLRETGHEDTIVPMVDFKIHRKTQKPRRLLRSTEEAWSSNLSTILQWSPYASEDELLKQFEDISSHGTKIVVYNLWLNDDGILELDFDADETDIQLRGSNKQEKSDKLQSQLTQQHISNRLRYSLRAYASMLYLEMPPNFQMVLRGTPIEHHSIANDLKFPQYILYKPQIGGPVKEFGVKEVSVITTIGFTKEAPMVNVHGFNVYHKNRLIMPFWKVLQENSSRGRGVVGVLEANFIEPAHDKQDFEKTALLLRLETRLKQMTIEYWNLHCELIGYQRSTPRSRQIADAASLAACSLPPTPVFTSIVALPHTPVTAGVSGAVPQANVATPYSNFQHQQHSSHGPLSKQSSENLEGLQARLDSNATSSQPHVSSVSVNPCSRDGQLDAPESNGLVKVKTELLEDASFKRKIEDLDLIDKEDAKRKHGDETLRLENDQMATNQAANGQVSEAGPHLKKDIETCDPTQENLAKIMEENRLLKERCIEYQQREQELEQIVDRLERELLESKAKYIEALKNFGGNVHNEISAGGEKVLLHHVKQETL